MLCSGKTYNFVDFEVALVDANTYMRGLTKSMLKSFGVGTVWDYGTSDAAFTLCTDKRVDFILVDWMVEPLDGYEFVRRIRALESETLNTVPIIVVTGHSEQFRVVEARDVGVNEFLAKPLSAQTLFDRIVSLIDRPRPFIRTKSFYGPDRRRHTDGNYTGPGRRRSDTQADDAAPPAPDLIVQT